nr:PREDICTED: rho GTPase-activating protein 30 [Latimeria chalumnae]|eukprot:XP_014349318.1 PREDICTED: rho GTPase-activating protein 30 [Latimeria chalumnae]
MRHLVHMASYSLETSMHARNLAIVWAPNLLRSKDIEASGFNGTAAFMEVRVQSIVVEFVLTHVEQLFGNALLSGWENDIGKKCVSSPSTPPTNVDDGYFRSIPCNVPSMLNMGDGPPPMRPYHTIIELSDQKRKGSLKVKKWKSIFNLGKSNDSKRKGHKTEKESKSCKANLRPAKSMDSLSSVPHAASEHDSIGKRLVTQVPMRHESFGPSSKWEEHATDTEAGGGTALSRNDSAENKGSMDDLTNAASCQSEAVVKSEPSTPKLTRTPHSRSPMGNKNRAEKCAGVHISGPFSVSIPYHITSTLGLTGLPSHLVPTETNEADGSEPAAKEEEQSAGDLQASTKTVPKCSTGEEADHVATKGPANLEGAKLSLEVDYSFSFLDSQDALFNLGCYDTEDVAEMNSDSGDSGKAEEGDEVECFKSCHSELECDEDLGSGYMNDMIGMTTQIEEFSVEPPPDYLCLEEGMYGLSEDELDQMYSIADQEPQKEVEYQSEEEFLSATDELSPVLRDLGDLKVTPASEIDGVPSKALPVEEVGQDPLLQHVGEADNFEPKPVCSDPAETLEKNICEDTPDVVSFQNQDSLEGEGTTLTKETEPEPHICEDTPDVVSLQNQESLEGESTILMKETEPESHECPPPAEDENKEIVSALTDNQTEELEDNATQGLNDQLSQEASKELPCELQVDQSHLLELSLSEYPEVQTDGSSNPKEPEIPLAVSERSQSDCKEDRRNSSDGSVSMTLTSSVTKKHQAKSVPVVPPKPQFAKFPPAIKSKLQAAANSDSGQSSNSVTKFGKLEEVTSVESPDSNGQSLQKQNRRSSWRSSGSISFDAAVALAKERQLTQSPVRRMQTYCSGDSIESHGISKIEKTSIFAKVALKQTVSGSRPIRPHSCLSPSSSSEVLGNESSRQFSGLRNPEVLGMTVDPSLATNHQEHPARNRFSMPRIGQRSDVADVAPPQEQRRSLAFEIRDRKTTE